MDTIRFFFLKSGQFFPIFKKEQGKARLPPPLVARLEVSKWKKIQKMCRLYERFFPIIYHDKQSLKMCFWKRTDLSLFTIETFKNSPRRSANYAKIYPRHTWLNYLNQEMNILITSDMFPNLTHSQGILSTVTVRHLILRTWNLNSFGKRTQEHLKFQSFQK